MRNRNDNSAFYFFIGAVATFSYIVLSIKKKKEKKHIPDRIIIEKGQKFPSNIMEWIIKNLHYPLEAKQEGIEGRVVVRFTVDDEGKVSNAKITESIDSRLDEQALKTIYSMPKWNVGNKGSYLIPIYFIIQ